uniref:Putative ABC-type nitrate/sulfonate/bicarbonate transport system, periplasmic component n=1 Tax=Rhodococcus sp. PY11 TaxID=551544 RepID=B5MAB9_9NOCA|nr:putative ABC-type nitrate/sulfonate/bicarbonate transport system, periplasmic component [Rhodococcus sp. PY11]
MSSPRRRWFTAIAISVALTASLTACSSGSGAAVGDNGLPIVRFSALPDPAPLPVLVMQENGIDEKYGFDAEFLEVDPDVATTTFLMGESDIAIDQDAVGSAIANNEGHSVVSFYPALSNTASIVTRPDTGIDTPADLVGKRVGHFGMDSGTTQAIGVSLKEGFGIDITSFELVQSSPASLPELLASGEVDAIFDYEPYSSKAIESTGGKYVFQVTPYWNEAANWSPPLAMLTARAEWLSNNGELAQNVLKAWQEAEKIIADSGYQLFLQEPYAGFLDRDSVEELQTLATYCAQLPCYPGTWTQADVDEQMKYLQLLVDAGMLAEIPDTAPVATLDSLVTQ